MPDLPPVRGDRWSYGTRSALTTAVALVCAVTTVVAAASCSSPGDIPAPVTATPTAAVTQDAAAPTAAATAEAPSGESGTGPAGAGPTVTAALAVLDTLPVKGRAPKTGYGRDLFGGAWTDVDGNGCDTRNDILARDLTDVTYEEGSCRVLSGTLDDPYTAQTVHFVRGRDTSTAVQVDHLVALSDAWQKGAQQLSPQRRLQLANDPANLLAVDGPANMQKSDGDAATWLPANKAFRCTYVSKQIDVKAAYGLWVTQAEKDAMVRVLSGCGAAGTAAGDTPAAGGDAGAEVYYANCSAARAAGAAPLYRGDPGYRSGMDGDNDGVACE